MQLTGLICATPPPMRSEKYRLAAAHKRKRPEAESAPAKGSDKSSTATREDMKGANRPSRSDLVKNRESSPRNRDKDSGSRGRGTEEKGGRTSSRDSRKDRDESSRSRHRTDLDRRDNKNAREHRTSGRIETGGGDMGEVDEEERDRRMMEEIRRRMEDRRASKETSSGRTDAKDVKTRTGDAKSTHEKNSRKGIEELKKTVAKVAGSRRGSKKASDTHSAPMTAEVIQRVEAVQWASGAASETEVGKSSAADEVLVRTNVIQKTTEDKGSTVAIESEESLVAQNFIAAQYPPVGGEVSETIRMGRALVSGALGMQTDDPKFFEATVKLSDCVVVLQLTRKKARTPVSAPPPNSIDSEVDGNDSCDVLLSQSATDVGVYIELPGGLIDTTTPEKTCAGDRLSLTDVRQADAPSTPVMVATPVISVREMEADMKTRNVMSELTRAADKMIKERIVVGPSKEAVAESQRILKEIDGAKLLQDELMRRDPSLVSASSFLSTVCGGGPKDNNMKKKDELKNKTSDIGTGEIPPSIQTRSESRYTEKPRTTRIVATTSLLEEELDKSQPSLASVATFRAAAYGDDISGKAEGVDKSLVTETSSTDAIHIPDVRRSVSAGIGEPEGEVQRGDEAPMEETSEDIVVVVDDAAMSVGDSEEEGSESDGFSRTDSNSSRGESTHSQNNRKRPADESPERDETRRREFPGTITRSEGGCRVHIPSSIRAGALEIIARMITLAVSTTDTSEAANTTGVQLIPNTTGVLPTTDTTDAAGAQGASTDIGVTQNEESISGINATSEIDVIRDNVHMTSIVYEEIVILLEPLSTIADDAPINLVGPTLPEQIDMERDVIPEPGRGGVASY